MISRKCPGKNAGIWQEIKNPDQFDQGLNKGIREVLVFNDLMD